MPVFSYSNPFGPTRAGWKSVWSPELGRFAAVGSDGAAASSPDGTSWTPPFAFGSGNPGICWSPDLGLFCAVNLNAATSPDGITWTDHGAFAGASTFGYNSVCWSPDLGLFCAVSDGNYYSATSPDGITWTETDQSSLPSGFRAGDIVWVGSQFVAYGSGAFLVPCSWTSPDGVTWTTHYTSLPAGTGNALAWSPALSQFVGVSAASGLGNDEVATSPDGVTWTSQGAPFGNPGAWDVCWSPERAEYAAVVGDSNGTGLFTSPDGATWAYQGTPFPIYNLGVEWSPALGVYCILGGNGDTSETAALWPVDSGLHIAARF